MIVNAANRSDICDLGALHELSQLNAGERWLKDPLEKLLAKGRSHASPVSGASRVPPKTSFAFLPGELLPIPSLLASIGGPDCVIEVGMSVVYSWTPLCMLHPLAYAKCLHL